VEGIAGAADTQARAWGVCEDACVASFSGEIVASIGARRCGRRQKRAALREKVYQNIPTMFPLDVRWQVIRNLQRGLAWDSIVLPAGCSFAAAHEWLANV